MEGARTCHLLEVRLGEAAPTSIRSAQVAYLMCRQLGDGQDTGPTRAEHLLVGVELGTRLRSPDETAGSLLL
jgi:hypothetical protein